LLLLLLGQVCSIDLCLCILFATAKHSSFGLDALRELGDELTWLLLLRLCNDAVLFSPIDRDVAQLELREAAVLVRDFSHRCLILLLRLLVVGRWLVPIIEDCLFSFLKSIIYTAKVKAVAVRCSNPVYRVNTCDCRWSLLLQGIGPPFLDKPSWAGIVECGDCSLCASLISP